MKGIRVVAMIVLGVLVGYFYRDSAPAVMLERFVVSNDELTLALHDAEKLWEDALCINLFEFGDTPSARTIPVNLIYDTRQIQSDVSRNVRDVLGNKRSELTAMEEQ